MPRRRASRIREYCACEPIRPPEPHPWDHIQFEQRATSPVVLLRQHTSRAYQEFEPTEIKNGLVLYSGRFSHVLNTSGQIETVIFSRHYNDNPIDKFSGKT